MVLFKRTLCTVVLIISVSCSVFAGNIGGLRTNAAGNIGGLRTSSAGNIGGLRTNATGNIGGLRVNPAIGSNTENQRPDGESALPDSFVAIIRLILESASFF